MDIPGVPQRFNIHKVALITFPNHPPKTTAWLIFLFFMNGTIIYQVILACCVFFSPLLSDLIYAQVYVVCPSLYLFSQSTLSLQPLLTGVDPLPSFSPLSSLQPERSFYYASHARPHARLLQTSLQSPTILNYRPNSLAEHYRPCIAGLCSPPISSLSSSFPPPLSPQ